MNQYEGSQESGEQQQAPGGPMPPEGFYGQNNAGVLRELLNSGDTFEDQLLRAGISQEDAEDIASMFRTGITFQVPELVLHAQHSLIAAAGENDKAKLIALAGITGRPPGAPPIMQQRSMIARRFFGARGKTDARSLS